MSIFKMLFSEAWQRKGIFFLSLLTVALAVALFIALLTLNKALQKETTQQMKAMGFNLVILPESATPENYLASEYGNYDIPEACVDKLAMSRKITADHFSGRLEKKIDWEGRTAILTGVMGTRARGQKKPLGFNQPPKEGTAYFGFEVARSVKVAKDSEGKPVFDENGRPKLNPVTVMGQTFDVAKRLARKEIKDNMRIYINVRDAQRMLKKPGRIHAIEALGCRCEGDIITMIQSEVEELLNKDAKEGNRAKVIIPDEPKFYTREKMRSKVEGYAALVVPVVLLVSVIWIGALSYMNVRQRREEIGLLRAVGVGSGPIAILFLGKAALVGFVGAGIGFAIGSAVARQFGPSIFELAAKTIKPMWAYLVWSVISAPVMAVLASALPAMVAVSVDPAEALREE